MRFLIANFIPLTKYFKTFIRLWFCFRNFKLVFAKTLPNSNFNIKEDERKEILNFMEI
jgi:hypothetical protein